MASDSHIAIATDCSSSTSSVQEAAPDSRTLGRRVRTDAELRSVADPAAASATAAERTQRQLHPLWRAALDADERGEGGFSISRLWGDLVSGHVRVWGESVGAERVVLVLRSAPGAQRVCDQEALLVARVLCGDAQKVIASELGIAASTGSARYVRGLAKLGLSPRHVPLAVVLAAQSASGIRSVVRARGSVVDHERGWFGVVSVPRCATAGMTQLTRAEQSVAQAIIDGDSRADIARRRGTSVHTVAGQFHSIFGRMKVTGRFALIRRAMEIQAFDGTDGEAQQWIPACTV